eukprot:5342543-Lingulodinium_polyedra.AAC.1
MAGVVVCPFEGLNDQNCNVYFLRRQMTAICLRHMNVKEARVKVLELPLNYEEHMVRYQFPHVAEDG